MVWSTFDRDRQLLDNQFENPDFNPQSGLDFALLEQGALDVAERLEGQPHPIVKARAFEFILDHVQIGVHPFDWFGVCFNGTRVTGKRDIGWGLRRILDQLKRKWVDELNRGATAIYTSQRAVLGRQSGLFVMYPDYDHTAPSWERILELGFQGLLDRVRSFKAGHETLSPEQEAFFEGIEITYTAIIRFVERLAAEVGRHENDDPKMPCLHRALNKLAHQPPESTYEVMVLALLYWDLQENVEGFRVRTLGDLGNLYDAFYRRDLERGTFTGEQIKELFKYFMNQFSARHVMYQQPMYFGSMDADGNVEINELSRLIFDAYDEANLYDPKLQVCVSEKTPDAFVKRVLEAIRGGNSSISLINSENTIAALMKTGATLAEARTFTMTGCWDFAVKNHEAKTIPLRLNLPKVLELTLNDGMDPLSGNRLGPALAMVADLTTFDAFYAAFKARLGDTIAYMMDVTNTFERYLHEYNPASMYSATIEESLVTGIDAYAFGAKYCTTCLNVSCLATTVDALAAIRKFVFERRELSLPELVEVLKRDWEGHERLRQRILADPDKYGSGSPLADDLMVDLTDCCTSLINNKPNGRGGFYKQGQITIHFYLNFGAQTGATPDGRRKGEPHSKNLSPTLGMDRGGLTGMINSVSRMDMSNFSHAGMLDIILSPTAISGDEGLDVMLAVIRAYFRKGGHSIQGNVFSSKLLRAAQERPEHYQNLQVRVCGWNVYFVALNRREQDLFIAQAEHLEKVG